MFLKIQFLFLLLGNVEAFKYIIYNPIYAPSHVTFADKIARTLRQAGHTVIQINPVQTMNFDLKKLDHPDNWIRWPKTIEVKDEIPSRLAKEMWEQDGLSVKELFKQFHDVGSNHARHCEDQLQDEEYLQRLRDEHFDLAITEFYDICGLGIFEKIGVKKYVAFTPFPMMLHLLEALGLPLASSFVPDLSTVSGPHMSFSMRVRNFGSSWLVGSVNKWSLAGYTEKVIQKYVNPNFDATKSTAEASYYFVNSDAILDFNRPLSDKFIHIGGLGISDASNKPLDAKFQQIMDSSKDGVILVSFGTIALSHEIPQRIKQIFLDAFAEFPSYTFLWKYEKPEHRISANYSNVVEATWIPQRDLFEHPKLMGFLTHGGLNSIMESAYGGVPVISIGLFGDQQRNGKMAEFRGFGIYLDKALLSKELLVESLRELIENDKYRKRAKEIAEMLKQKPLKSEDLVVKYTEYATKFDVHPYLDLPGRHMSFVKYHSLDVIAFFILIILLLLSTIVGVFYALVTMFIYVYRLLRTKDAKHAKKNE